MGWMVFIFRRSLLAQIASILTVAFIHALFLVASEILPGGGLSQHENTWQGYALIELGPFLVVVGVVVALRSVRLLEPLAVPAVVAVAVPISYWVGLLIAISLAVTSGLAAP